MNLLRQTALAMLMAASLPAIGSNTSFGTPSDDNGRKYGLLAADRNRIEVYSGDECAFLGVQADGDFTVTTGDAGAPAPMFSVKRVTDGLLRLDFTSPAAESPETVDLILRSADGRELRVPVSRHAGNPNEDRDFANYIKRKRPLVTARWTKPYAYADYRTVDNTCDLPDGPYLGNGDAGVANYFTNNAQLLRIHKVDFVTDNKSDWAGTGAAALPTGGVRIIVDDTQNPSALSYTMDQVDAEMTMTTGTRRPVEMKTWLARRGNWVVTTLTTQSETPIRVSVETFADSTDNTYASLATLKDGVAQAMRYTRRDNTVKWTSVSTITSRIMGAEVIADSKTSHKAVQEFMLTREQPVQVVALVAGGGKSGNGQTSWSRKEINALDAEGLQDLRRHHDAFWRDMWSRSYVETGDDVLDRQYLSSIYLLASAYDRNSPAHAGIFGMWVEDDTWYHGDIHLNYNSQGNLYSVYSANRPELANSFYTFCEKMIPEGRRRAQNDLHNLHPSMAGKKCRGILFPVSALGIGEFYGPYWNNTMCAPFNVCLYSWHYEYTGDEDFLREHTYPYLREVGDFYEDYLEKEPYGDSYRYSIHTGAHEGSWDLNPPSDLCFVEQTFRLLLKYSKHLGVDADHHELWNDILGHLPTYQVMMPQHQPNQGKPIYSKNESPEGWDWPAHAIQMQCVYPAEVIHIDSPADSVEIARNTIYYYEVDQNGFNGWDCELGLGAFVMGARLGMDPDMLLKHLKIQAQKISPNLVIQDAIERTALVESINSMMMQSTNDVLRFFPCWPKGRAASFTRLRTKGAFLVSARYDGTEISSIRLLSEKGNPCTFVNPWPGREVKVRTAGGAKQTLAAVGADRLTFPTEAGVTYIISRK